LIRGKSGKNERDRLEIPGVCARVAVGSSEFLELSGFYYTVDDGLNCVVYRKQLVADFSCLTSTTEI